MNSTNTELLSMTDNLPKDMIYIILDTDGSTLYSSSFELIGYENKMDLYQLIHQDKRDELKQKICEVVKHKKNIELKYKMLHKRGDWVDISITVQPSNNRGQVKWLYVWID